MKAARNLLNCRYHEILELNLEGNCIVEVWNKLYLWVEKINMGTDDLAKVAFKLNKITQMTLSCSRNLVLPLKKIIQN